MKKQLPVLSFIFLLFLNCGNISSEGTDVDENPLLTSCRMTRYLGTDVDMHFEYTPSGLVEKVDYEISSFVNEVNVTHDAQNRLSRITFSNSDIFFEYGLNTITVTNDFSFDVGATSTTLGSGEFVYHLDDNGHFIRIEENGQPIMRFENDAFGNIKRIFRVNGNEENLVVENLVFDSQQNPWREFPFTFYLTFPQSSAVGRLIFEFAPWQTDPNNTERATLLYTDPGTDINLTFNYNSLGYPIGSSGTSVQTWEYECQ